MIYMMSSKYIALCNLVLLVYFYIADAMLLVSE